MFETILYYSVEGFLLVYGLFYLVQEELKNVQLSHHREGAYNREI